MNRNIKLRLMWTAARLPMARAGYLTARRLFASRENLPPPQGKIRSALDLADAIRPWGSIEGATILEIGTGKRLNVPIVMWLLGAERTVSVDIVRDLYPRRVASDIKYYRSARPQVAANLLKAGGDGAIERLDQLLGVVGKNDDDLTMQILDLCNIIYLAPADGGNLNIPDGHFDIHLSISALEHAPLESVQSILHTASRLLRPGGICAHFIDHSDHYAHHDAGLSPINFLRFDDPQWSSHKRLTSVNGLRASEYLPLFENAGLNILTVNNTVDNDCANLIKSGKLPLAQRFHNYSMHDLATLDSLIVAVPR